MFEKVPKSPRGRQTFPERRNDVPTAKTDVIDAIDTVETRIVDGFRITLKILEVRTHKGSGYRASVEVEGGGGRSGDFTPSKDAANEEGLDLLDIVAEEQGKKIRELRAERRRRLEESLEDKGK